MSFGSVLKLLTIGFCSTDFPAKNRIEVNKYHFYFTLGKKVFEMYSLQQLQRQTQQSIFQLFEKLK